MTKVIEVKLVVIALAMMKMPKTNHKATPTVKKLYMPKAILLGQHIGNTRQARPPQ